MNAADLPRIFKEAFFLAPQRPFLVPCNRHPKDVQQAKIQPVFPAA